MRRGVNKRGNPTKNNVMPISSENCQGYCEKDLEVSFDGFMINLTDLSTDLDGSSVSSLVPCQNDGRNSFEKETEWFSSEQEIKGTPCEESSDLHDSESDNESLDDACAQSESDLLYSDAPITTTSSVVLLSFPSKYKLTPEAFNDLLVVIEAHCPQPNNCKTTVRKLLDFVSQVKGEIVKHYFCEYCKAYHGRCKAEVSGNCNICQKELSTMCGYFEVLVKKQLQNFFGGEHFNLIIISVY